MLFHTGVVGHTSRTEQAVHLAESTAAHLALDDGTLGCTSNHTRVLNHLSAHGCSKWAVVIEDDAQPVHGFHSQVDRALQAAPAPIVSFYLGTGYPRYWQKGIGRAIAKADHLNAHWILSDHLLHAVAYAIRTDLLPDLLTPLPNLLMPIDDAITTWARGNGHRVAYTWPSLVDHEDGESVIAGRTPRNTQRRAWQTGTRDAWRRNAITQLEY